MKQTRRQTMTARKKQRVSVGRAAEPPALQLAVDKHGLVLSNTIIADSMRDEQVDNFSRTRTPRRHIRIFCIECRSVANDRFLESNARRNRTPALGRTARLKEENARLTETMSDFQVRAASLAADESTLERLTTERDTLKANLTATNQSLDESNQRIYTSSEVSSLLSQN
ncbi:hypothetical protein BLNAU_25139 [Blattamonas nauphoetae]|uniref:Uncharacterized protein n=1 Tax=Blattamonas nauphoetae TaxID=2049346 RepID=A0ABQ9WL94_9EUKA|nr:hypothetical protein BLNAU_25139 [Blattamonas nauphoetae]